MLFLVDVLVGRFMKHFFGCSGVSVLVRIGCLVSNLVGLVGVLYDSAGNFRSLVFWCFSPYFGTFIGMSDIFDADNDTSCV